ncbi:hypothetical protein LUZ60_011622 [Juncus effusus]|nr:hypothetical protein LUZ60_011622 [Juncus effusus]
MNIGERMGKRSLKRSKMEQEDEEPHLALALSPYHSEEEKGEDQMTEEALILLLRKRGNEVHRCRSKIAHYESKVENAEKEINKTKEMLARLRSKKFASSGKKPVLNIPPKIHSKSTLASSSSSDRNSVPKPSKHEFTHKNNTENKRPRPLQEVNSDRNSVPIPSNHEIAHERNTGENKLIGFFQEVNTCKTPKLLNFNASNLFSSQHKRKLRCLELCPTDDTLFATSALDGNINLWEIQSFTDKSRASLLYSFDFLSPRERKWPEDIAWHPQGKCIFSVHTADKNESQVAMINISESGMKKAVFLEGKPHLKGVINRINFMLWVNQSTCFTTCGSDHGVVLWKESEQSNLWTQKLLHRDLHSSTVMAAFGPQNKEAVLSVGRDKRVVLYDLGTERCEFKFFLDAKCLNVLPNPTDSNLYMVQLGEPEKQLRLFDMRGKHKEVHAFGWKQDHSESQSALVNPAWSLDGWQVSTGSADNFIHFFDIRYKSNVPSQSLKAHSKRVFKAVWHPTSPLLISISSDLNIGLHNYH